jgi:hypothetical protein
MLHPAYIVQAVIECALSLVYALLFGYAIYQTREPDARLVFPATTPQPPAQTSNLAVSPPVMAALPHAPPAATSGPASPTIRAPPAPLASALPVKHVQSVRRFPYYAHRIGLIVSGTVCLNLFFRCFHC